MADPIPVVCDLCRAEGESGAGVFEQFGALLDFDPVPRRTARADGWDALTQRAYVAALSLTGSARAACRAVGRSAFGVEQLHRHPEGDGFRAACEEAMRVAADERGRRLAEGLRTIASEQAGWRPPPPPWRRRDAAAAALPPPPPPPPDEAQLAETDAALVAVLEKIVGYYTQRLGMEREARLAGRIVEADFYIRQVTAAEIWLQLLAAGRHDVVRLMKSIRLGPRRRSAMEVAETFLSRVLDDARRRKWRELAEPDRPPLPTPDQMFEEGGHMFLSTEETRGGPDWRDQQHAQERATEEAARAQAEWEEEARKEAEAWAERLAGEAEAAAEEEEEDGGGEGEAAG